MRIPGPLSTGVFLRRYKRFFADVRLDTGEEVTAHCANTGSMRACTAPLAPVRLSLSDNPRRKLPYSLEQIQVDGRWIVVNTARPNAVVHEALAAGTVPELAGYGSVRREVRLGESRIDFLLEGGAGRAWVEVKSVTLCEGERLSFPDAVTTRGTRHLEALMGALAPQTRAVLFLLVGTEGGTWFEPADDIDPAWGGAVRRARAAGVEVIARRCTIEPQNLTVGEPVEMRWLTSPRQ
jgi:sugar fermentation stimulation protein A